ncbi:MAG: hypothetical protein WC353_03045 [Candidatus Peribacter sp.]|jgi:cation:H+ antiporter
MTVILHLLLLLLSAAIIWALSGLLIGATDRVAKRYNRPGFAIAFFVLGVLTSISEISVATNATLEGVPQVSAGNLVGGSIVIFLLIIPLLAVLGGGLPMTSALTRGNLAFLLGVVVLPSLLILDGSVSRVEGVLMVFLYVTLLYTVQKRKPAGDIVEETMQHVEEELLHTKGMFFTRHATLVDVAKIAFAGVLIFLGGKLLVHESIYFSTLLSIPPSLVGLILLSIGTNAPELVIAVRCIVGKHKDIAFGDYMGSAAANTPLMGFLALANGKFALERSEFVPTFFLLLIGLIAFFVFSRSKNDISRKEGIMLLCLYGGFLVMQFINIARFAGE